MKEQFELNQGNREHDLELIRQHFTEEVKLAEKNKEAGKDYDVNLIGIDEKLLTPEELILYEKVQAAPLASESDRALTTEEIARLQKELHGADTSYGEQLTDEQKKQKFYEIVSEERIKDTHGNFFAMLRNRILKIQATEKLKQRKRKS